MSSVSRSAEFRHAADQQPDDALLLERAQFLYSRRRMRERFFDPALFGEPAWDIMLDLFIAERQHRRVSLGDACIGANVPSSTALRWLRLLEGKDLISRFPDAFDARRHYLRLTANGNDALVRYLERW